MKKLDANLKVIIAIIVLFGLSISLMAQSRQNQQKPYHEKSGYNMLNLTDQQKEEIKEIRIAKMKNVQPLRDQILINKAKINALVHNDDPDMNKIVSLVEANGKILTEIKVNSITSKLKIRALLTEEQKVTFDAHSGKMKRQKALAHHRHKQRTGNRSRF